jgi:hypothetical protein
MGKIVNRGSVCLKASSACNVQSHKTKMRVRMEHFYIQSKQYQLRIEPSLDGELLPDDITTQSLLDGDPADRDVLMAYVQNLQAKDEGLGATGHTIEEWESVTPPSLEAMKAVKSSFKTPKKLKLGDLMDAAVDASPVKLGVKAARLMIDPIPKAAVKAGIQNLSEAGRKVLEQWNPLTLVLEQLWDKINAMSESGGKLAEATLKLVAALQEALGSINMKLQILDAAKSSHGDGGEEIDTLSEELVSLRKLLEPFKGIGGADGLVGMDQDLKKAQVFLTGVVGRLDTLEAYAFASLEACHGALTKMKTKARSQAYQLDVLGAGLTRPGKYRTWAWIGRHVGDSRRSG